MLFYYFICVNLTKNSLNWQHGSTRVAEHVLYNIKKQKGCHFLEVVPYWVMIPYGFVERVVILEFICSASGIKIKRCNLLIASLIGLFFTLAVRAIFPGNYFIISLSSLISDVAIVWVFTGITGVRVWISATIVTFIAVMIEVILYIYATQPLLKFFSFISVWVLTGIPHIVVILLALQRSLIF